MKVLVILLGCMGAAWAQSGLDICLQRPYGGSAASSTGILSLSYYAPSWNRLAGFAEYGVVGMPSLGFREDRVPDHKRTTSFVGLFGGHLFLLKGGHLRPGFTLGTIWEETAKTAWREDPATHVLHQGTEMDSKISPYFAFKFQILLFSFILSNKGFGGGVNFTL